MSIKWAFGAVIAVLSAMLVLPGVVSAHEASLSGQASECRDAQGAFNIDWTLQTFNTPSYRELDGFDDSGYDTGSNDTTESVDDGVIDVVDGGVAPSLGLEDFTVQTSDSGPTGQTLDDDGIHGNGTASAQTVYDGSSEPNETIYAEGRVQWTSTSGHDTYVEQNVRSNDIARPDYCLTTACVDGDFVDQPVNDVNATNDCDPVRLCLVDGESVTVTEFEAAQIEGATPGSCTPTENPPPPPPTITEEVPPAPEENVSEVSPAVEEVVALPAAGYGETSSGIGWTALAAIALLGIGGSTVLVARRKS